MKQERILEADGGGEKPVLRRDPVVLIPHEAQIPQDELSKVLSEVAEEEQSVDGDRVNAQWLVDAKALQH